MLLSRVMNLLSSCVVTVVKETTRLHILVMRMVAVHGTMAAFNPASENWRAYIERLEHYFITNKIETAERKSPILLSVCGAETYQLIRDLVFPARPAEETFVVIVELVTKHYSPKAICDDTKLKFNSRRQGKDELSPPS